MSSSKAATAKTQSRSGAATRAKASRPASRARAAKAASETAAAAAPQATAANLGPQMGETAAAIEKALRTGDLAALPAETLQQLIAAVTKAYSAKTEAGEQFHPVSRAGRLTPTDIMVMANGLLRSGNLQIFELGMWQSWTGH